MIALSDRVSTPVDRAEFDDLVTLVTQAPTWEKDRLQGIRVMLRAIAAGNADAPDQILARWTWRLARASRKAQDRKASQEFPEAKRLLGALANSRGHRHEENAARLVNAALEQPVGVGVALLASADAYTPRTNQLLDAARERLGTVQEIAGALADNLPAPKLTPSRKRRRRRKKKGAQAAVAPQPEQQEKQDATAPEPEAQAPALPQNGAAPADEGNAGEAAPPKRRRRRRKPAADADDAQPVTEA
jgi:hypothetical protein